MDIQAWLLFLTTLLRGVLAGQGKTQQVEALDDALAAVRAGHNVDDIMRRYAEKWAQDGEPSLDDIAALRQDLQARVG